MTPDEIQKDREAGTLLTGAVRIKLADLADAYLALTTENAALKARVAELEAALDDVYQCAVDHMKEPDHKAVRGWIEHVCAHTCSIRP